MENKKDKKLKLIGGAANRVQKESCPEGIWPAKIVDFIDKGEQQSQYDTEPKPKFSMVFEVDANGKQFTVHKLYNNTLGNTGRFALDMKPIRGRFFTEDEQQRGLEPEMFIGTKSQVLIAHVVKNGVTYSNIVSILPLPILPPHTVPPKPTPETPPHEVTRIAEDSTKSEAYNRVQDLIGNLIDDDDITDSLSPN